MIIIALVIIIPIVYYYMSDWLSTFYYKINITIIEFIFSGILVVLIVLITTSYMIMKAILTKPSGTLKEE